jgi:hypothetical protein
VVSILRLKIHQPKNFPQFDWLYEAHWIFRKRLKCQVTVHHSKMLTEVSCWDIASNCNLLTTNTSHQEQNQVSSWSGGMDWRAISSRSDGREQIQNFYQEKKVKLRSVLCDQLYHSLLNCALIHLHGSHQHRQSIWVRGPTLHRVDLNR